MFWVYLFENKYNSIIQSSKSLVGSVYFKKYLIN
jgi:hypothetical protein